MNDEEQEQWTFYSRDLGWRSTVFFVDDNLIGHKKSLKNELLPGSSKGSSRSAPPGDTPPLLPPDCFCGVAPTFG